MLARGEKIMSQDLISKKLRYEVREYLVSWTLREIEIEFDSADIPLADDYKPSTSGQRRTLVEQYLHSLDFSKPADAKKFLRVCEGVLNRIDGTVQIPSEWNKPQQEARQRILQWLRKDGYAYEEGHVIGISGSSHIAAVQATALEFNAEYLMQQIRRIERSVDIDTAQAIGSAKELVETCCKTILLERGKPVTDKPDVQPLVRRTAEELKLVPDKVPELAKGAESIKKLLGNLAAVCQSLAELRNLYGTGHGKEGRTKGLLPRHAKLAVGAAATLAVFLFETHKDRLAT
jgi:hypothetical protein